MVYIRRYLSGQQATTVVIAQRAITADKIASGAVTHPKIAPGAVDSERIADGSIRSEDIKAGEVKTSDLAPGAVTTDKIASQAVTVDKLETALQDIDRPLVPGVDTAEIQNAKVTLAKLAPDSVDASKIKGGAVTATKLNPDAVETVKIKDGACTRDKIGVDAIVASKIATDAVTGAAILSRTVGSTEIAIDGVQNENIKDLQITTDKLNLECVTSDKLFEHAVTSLKLDTAALAKRHLLSFDVRVDRRYEQFNGAGSFDKWRKRVDAGGSVLYSIDADYAGVSLATPAITGKRVVLDWDEQTFRPDWGKVDMAFIVLPSLKDYHTRELGLVTAFDKAEYIMFTAEDAVGGVPNWFARCKLLGAETAVDTGIAVADVPQILDIEYLASDSVKLYIDGALVATIETNIPATYRLDPWMSVIARSNAARYLWVEMMSMVRERPV